MAEKKRGRTVSGTLGAAGASLSSVEVDECAPIASCRWTLSTTLTASAVRSTFHAAAEAPRARSESKLRDQASCTDTKWDGASLLRASSRGGVVGA